MSHVGSVAVECNRIKRKASYILTNAQPPLLCRAAEAMICEPSILVEIFSQLKKCGCEEVELSINQASLMFKSEGQSSMAECKYFWDMLLCLSQIDWRIIARNIQNKRLDDNSQEFRFWHLDEQSNSSYIFYHAGEIELLQNSCTSKLCLVADSPCKGRFYLKYLERISRLAAVSSRSILDHAFYENNFPFWLQLPQTTNFEVTNIIT